MRHCDTAVKESAGIKDLEATFRAYLNNKMMMLLLMIEHPGIARDVLSVERQRIFLQDLYHHFLPQDAAARFHRVFKWLDLFLTCYPDAGPRRIHRASEMVGVIYEAFGMKLRKRVESIRIEREMIGMRKKKGE
jgi:hypothetical protein